MSQIRKSASFRSRIPIRARAAPRRCYSPEPYKNLSTSTMYEPNHNDYVTKPIRNHGEQRISKQKMKRQRHIATTLAQQAQHTNKTNNDASITSVTNFPGVRPKTIYSSSSYSSSDESQESEAPPPQVRRYNIFNAKLENFVQIQIYCNPNRCSLAQNPVDLLYYEPYYITWIYWRLLSNEIRKSDRMTVV